MFGNLELVVEVEVCLRWYSQLRTVYGEEKLEMSKSDGRACVGALGRNMKINQVVIVQRKKAVKI